MKKRRDYDNDFPSVTQVLDVLRKIGLELWYKKNTPEFIAEESKKAKEIGTATHDAIQAHIEATEVKVETPYPAEVMNAVNSFMLFKKEHPQVKLHRAEIKMTSVAHKVNGTLDALGEDDLIMVVDWKTTNAKDKDKPAIYDEWVWQVAAYVCLYNESHAQNVRKALIVSLAKDKIAYDVRFIGEQEIQDAFNEVFLPALRILTYQRRPKNG